MEKYMRVIYEKAHMMVTNKKRYVRMTIYAVSFPLSEESLYLFCTIARGRKAPYLARAGPP